MTRRNVECLCPRDFKLYWKVLARNMPNVSHWSPEKNENNKEMLPNQRQNSISLATLPKGKKSGSFLML